MMRLLAAIWENIYDLFVEDGSIALGTVIALVVVGIWSALTAAHSDAREWGGLLLFVLLMGLLLGNLYRTGQVAARKRVEG